MERWHVIEEASFETSVAQLGGARRVDEALAPIMDAVERNPLAFPGVPQFPGIRVAKTTLAVKGLELVPAMRVWLKPIEETRTVYLLYVDMAPANDMAFGDIFR